MKCSMVQELLLTDHIDGETPGGLRSEIERHCAECENCKAFERSVQQHTKEPFLGSDVPEVPLSVWNNISTAIDKEHEVRRTVLNGINDFFRVIFAPFRLRGPIFAFAGSAVVIVALIAVLIIPKTSNDVYVQEFLSDNILYLTSLGGSESTDDDNGDVDFDTTIEVFFM